MTNRVFQSFSKRLSRRLLIVFVLTITVISALVVTLATFGMKTMTDAYFYSQLEEINEMVSTVQAMGESNDQIYERMKRADIRINKFYVVFSIDNHNNNSSAANLVALFDRFCSAKIRINSVKCDILHKNIMLEYVILQELRV